MKDFLIIKLVVWFGWLSYIALAQLELSNAVRGSVSFPEVGITCVGNLAAFITSYIRRRLDLEMGARDFMATMTGACKLEETELEEKQGGKNVKTVNTKGILPRNNEGAHASVVMLSSDVSNSSIRQFMKYMHNAHRVDSRLLPCCPLKNVPETEVDCNCIEFWAEPHMRLNVQHDPQMPQIPKTLSDSGRYLLPCLNCLKKGRHGYDPDPQFLAVCDALDFDFTTFTQEKQICICIPMKHNSEDDWTKLLIRIFKSKDQEDRGTISMAADALQGYLAGKKEDREEKVSYTSASIIVPRLAEISINILLTFWFNVDGFSSSVAARRAVRNYIVDSKGTGFPANAFLTGALVIVKSNDYQSSACQVLSFRGTCLRVQTLTWIVGFVNLSCSIIWVVFITFDVGLGKWYRIKSMPPSKPRVAVMIAGICISWFMDLYELVSKKNPTRKIRVCLLPLIVMEIGFAAVAGALGLNKGIGRWVYGALQVLVWVKWGIGSYLIGVYSPEYDPRRAKRCTKIDGRHTLTHSSDKWIYDGTLVYSSAFLLNAFLAGVRGDWARVWKDWKLPV